MPYLLVPHFDPDFDHQHITPREQADGTVDHYNLGYTQNVVAGQVLAELRDVGEKHAALEAREDPRFVMDQPVLPAGPNTAPAKDNPRQLVATCNGYVFLHEGRIHVKKVLNVRGDVDFHTGNIFFVGDIVVHGDVRSGFELQGRNLLVKGAIEGAEVQADGSLVGQSGVKGQGECGLTAAKSVRLPFVEQALIVAGESVLVEGPALHTDIYAGGQVAVRGRCTDCQVFAGCRVTVAEHLGGGGGKAVTSVVLGYEPQTLFTLHEAEDLIRRIREELGDLAREEAKSQLHKEEYAPRRAELESRLNALYTQRGRYYERIDQAELMRSLESCVLAVPGLVEPGVEVAIGPHYLRVAHELHNVRFVLEHGDIAIKTPALGH